MKEANDKYDLQFKKLIDEAGLESPSEDFTVNVMQKIEQLQVEKEGLVQTRSFSNNWLLIPVIIAVFVIGYFVIDFFEITIISKSIKPIIAPLFASIFQSFSGIFDSVEISSTTVAIIFGFVGLVALERILNKLKVTRNIYFSF